MRRETVIRGGRDCCGDGNGRGPFLAISAGAATATTSDHAPYPLSHAHRHGLHPPHPLNFSVCERERLGGGSLKGTFYSWNI